MKIINYQDMTPDPVTGEGVSGVTIRWLISGDDGAPHFAMRLFEVQPGGNTPLHTHDTEHEVFILEGTGAVWREGKEVTLVPGTAVFVPPDEKHCFFNKGETVLKFICMVPVS